MPAATARVRARTDRRVDRHVDRGGSSVRGVLIPSKGCLMGGSSRSNGPRSPISPRGGDLPAGSGRIGRLVPRRSPVTTHAVAAFIVAESSRRAQASRRSRSRGSSGLPPDSAHRPNDAERPRDGDPSPCLSRRACVPRHDLRPMRTHPECFVRHGRCREKSQANAVGPAASEVRAMTILILGGDDDEHAMHMLDYLHQGGHDAELFDSRHFPARMQLAFDPRRGTGTIRLRGGRSLDIRRIRSVYWRSYHGIPESGLEDPEQAFIAVNDARGLLESLLIRMPARWVNGWAAYQLHQDQTRATGDRRLAGRPHPGDLAGQRPRGGPGLRQASPPIHLQAGPGGCPRPSADRGAPGGAQPGQPGPCPRDAPGGGAGDEHPRLRRRRARPGLRSPHRRARLPRRPEPPDPPPCPGPGGRGDVPADRTRPGPALDRHRPAPHARGALRLPGGQSQPHVPRLRAADGLAAHREPGGPADRPRRITRSGTSSPTTIP